ncbi:MAG: AtpZ/AtpI family protein [Leptospiraceae bacterium]|nr:AtpZ/AtpI family protein [Leptospiraceae bacterium]MDW8306649.1 AtpZ/AtpI family protein [Leptospiraceae bacterium]
MFTQKEREKFKQEVKTLKEKFEELSQKRKPHLKPSLGKFASLGFEFAIPIILGSLGGNYLDSKLESSPWFFIGGFVIGFILGFLLLIQGIQEL